jgi:hypothetical protein
MPPKFIEQQSRIADFLLSEAPGYRSRENAVLAGPDEPLPAGQVLAVVGGKYVPYVAADAATAPAAAILYAPAPASDTDLLVAVIVRDAEVAEALLVDVDAAAIADLVDVGIIVRD